jgi:galactitol-specific phosphotransferase system IIB component
MELEIVVSFMFALEVEHACSEWGTRRTKAFCNIDSVSQAIVGYYIHSSLVTLENGGGR